MRLLQLTAALASVAALVAARETVEDAARLSRQLVASTGISSLATVFPEDHPTLGGQALNLMEYHASCYSNGSLTVIFTPISLNSKNILKSQTHSATITVVETPTRASNARVALVGTMEIFFEIDATLRDELADCYTAVHPDAKRWIPGTVDAHPSWWARFDPHTAYWIGGFGGVHYIGYIPIDLYQSSGNTTTTGGLRIQV